MKNQFVLVPCLFALALSTILPATAQSIDDLVGEWGGSIDMGVAKLRAEFTFKIVDGELRGSMKSPQQSDQSFPLKDVTLEGDQLTVSIPAIAGTYTATLKTDPITLEGTWEQLGNKLPLNLQPEEAQAPPKRPQDPIPPFPYLSEEAEFENASANIRLAGTLTLPKEGKNLPAAILISGSGPQNRDEELMGHRPFAVIADHLTRQGIAVLRYDDRGVGKSEGDFSKATTKDFATDANAAWKFLSTHSRIDKDAIGMIGHSEGGYIAPLAFLENPHTAYHIYLAGPGLPLRIIAQQQSEIILKQVGLSDEAIASADALNEVYYNYYDAPEGTPFPAEEVSSKTKEWWEGLSEADKKKAEPFKAMQEANMGNAETPWTRFLMSYDPLPTLEKVTCPVLALNGQKDTQVLSKPNLEAIEEALTRGGNKNFEIHEIPNLNHLFQNATSGALMEYSLIEETFDVPTLDLISDWILKTTEKNSP